MIGNQTWDGSGDKKRFSLCGKVPQKLKKGKPITVKCDTPLLGSHLAVYLPKKRSALTLCEVDAHVLGDQRRPTQEDCVSKSSFSIRA